MALTVENKAKLTPMALRNKGDEMSSNKRKARPWQAAAAVGMAAMSLTGVCRAENVQVFPEPWQELDPGKPPENRPKIEIVSEGGGAAIEAGDLIQVTDRYWSNETGGYKGKVIESWLWIGFGSYKETAFYATNPGQRSALLGLKEGAVVKFLEYRDPLITQGKLFVNPLGDPEYYSWRKNVRGNDRITIPDQYGYSVVQIKRVCKGKAQYRTVRLFDDSYVQRCTFAPIRCEMLNTPREGWVDEAKIEAVCSDGKTATFQYGPVTSRNGKEWTGPVNPGNYFTPWEKAAWDKLPVGVQLK